jgi:phage baseplate assembly protein W
MSTRATRTFSDINLLFTKSGATADITKKLDEEAVKASLRNLISTKNFERPFHPEIGCQIYGLLFENVTPIIYQTMRKSIFDAIEKFEPRVKVLEVNVAETPDNNSIELSIIFRIINSERPTTLKTIIQRVR